MEISSLPGDSFLGIVLRKLKPLDDEESIQPIGCVGKVVSLYDLPCGRVVHLDLHGLKRFRMKEGWFEGGCGQACTSGNENLCGDARFTGYHVDGGYAEYLVVPEAFACEIPEGYNDHQAAPLLCAGIIGYRAMQISELKAGERLGLFGFGASAHIVIQIARHWGCQVYVFTRTESHRALARQLGAAWTGTAEHSPPFPLDRAILFAPAGRLVLDALRNLRRGGTLAIAAI